MVLNIKISRIIKLEFAAIQFKKKIHSEHQKDCHQAAKIEGLENLSLQRVISSFQFSAGHNNSTDLPLLKSLTSES